jgi:YD repeat-containing protein
MKKKQVEYLQRFFYDIWNDFGSVYLLVRYSSRTSIGKRGFTEEEKKRGLVLVFNDKTNTALDWDSEGNLTCVLAFGARKEDVYIHYDDLLGVFSAEAGVQYLRSDAGNEPAAPPESDAGQGDTSQVVSISKFKKRKATKRT